MGCGCKVREKDDMTTKKMRTPFAREIAELTKKVKSERAEASPVGLGRYEVVLHHPDHPWDDSRLAVHSRHFRPSEAEIAMLRLPRELGARAAIRDTWDARWNKGAKHEAGRNPLTIGERAKIRLKVLSPEAARNATSREKTLLREHTSAVSELKEAIEACKRCDRGAEKKAQKHLKEAKKSLEALERLAHYRSGPEIAAANIKRFRSELSRAESTLHGATKESSAAPKSSRSEPKTRRMRERQHEDVEESGERTLRSGELSRAAKHEAGNNPRTLQNILLKRKVAKLVGRGGR
jgi:hypothetical protein